MSIATSKILGDASKILRDEGTTKRWTDSELLTWLNYGQKAVCILKPDAYIVTKSMLLSEGTKQSLPDGTSAFQDPEGSDLPAGDLLIDISRNMGSDGLTVGRSISLVDVDLMDQFNPDWHFADDGEAVIHFMYDESMPKIFWNTPPVAADSVWVEITYAATPPDATALGNIILSDKFEAPLLDYILYRAYSKDATNPASATRASAYFQVFKEGIIEIAGVERMTDPNVGITKFRER